MAQRFCPRCGRPAAESQAFCENCGTPLQNTAAPAYPNPSAPPPPRNPFGQAPAPQFPYAGYQPDPPKKSKAGLIAGISVGAAVLAALAAVLLFVRPGFLKKDVGSSGTGTAYFSVQSSGTQSSASSGSSGQNGASPFQTQTTAQSPSAVSEEEETDAGNPDEPGSPAEPAEAVPSGTGSGNASSGETASPADTPSAADFSDLGRPAHADFDWLQDVVFRDVYPENSEIFKDADTINGRWKGMFLFPDGDAISVMELVNAEIMAGDRAVTVVIDPYMVNFDNSEYEDESDMNDYSFDGAIDDGSINSFSDFGNLELDVFFAAGGKQYALGYFTVQSGERAYVGLVRP